MKLWFNILKWIAAQALRALYNYVDRDHDGKLSKDEIEGFVYQLRNLLSKMKNKAQK